MNIKSVKGLTRLLFRLDVADLSNAVRIPEDEYAIEAEIIYNYFLEFGLNNLSAFIESTFRESFEPMPINEDKLSSSIKEIIAFLIESKGE